MSENEETQKKELEKAKPTYKRLEEETERAINILLDDGMQTSDVEILCNLTKIYKNAKEMKNMRYSNYGNYGDYGNYGEYNDYGARRGGRRGSYGEYNEGSYGRRGVDSKYRGHEYIDEMYGEYGRYEEGREQYNRGNYGAKNETLKSLEYMLESATDFFKMLKNEAKSQEEMQLIQEYTKKISEM